MKISKTTMERRHAMQRAQERYGLTLNRATRDQIVVSIRSGKSRMVKRQSNRVTVGLRQEARRDRDLPALGDT